MKRLSCLVLLCLACHDLSAAAWKRHIIDGSSKGADGVRLADINGDGLQDITTGWEQGGTIRVYLNPGPAKSREAWPVVTVGNVGDVEDAVFADLDGDGAIDVVSCAEGKTRQLSFHWAPKDRAQQMNPAAWRTEPLPLANNKMMWMFALPMQVDGKNGTDIFAGGKNKDAALGWLEAPADAHDLNGWKWHELRPVGWLMSLIASDMDGDGDLDVVFSDRKGGRTGAFWLENPGIGPAQARPWKEHAIGGAGKEAMFLSLADLDGDGFEDVLLAVKPDELHWFRRQDRTGDSWTARILPAPPNSGTMKALSAADVNGDGKKDLIFSCENAKPPLEGMMWLTCDGPPMTGKWTARELSGAGGVKHDLIAMIDLDGDGDLDAITTEEVKNYGVIWYENPAK